MRWTETLETESKRVDASIRPFTGYRAMDVLIVERDPMVAEVLADALADVGITADVTADEDQAIADCHDSGARVILGSTAAARISRACSSAAQCELDARSSP